MYGVMINDNKGGNYYSDNSTFTLHLYIYTHNIKPTKHSYKIKELSIKQSFMAKYKRLFHSHLYHSTLFVFCWGIFSCKLGQSATLYDSRSSRSGC